MTVKPIQFANQLIADFEEVMRLPKKSANTMYYTGVDLGTSCIVLSVLDESFQPVAGNYREAHVVKDGMVVDYLGAIQIVRELKEELEGKLGHELRYCGAAIPPGTERLDSGVIRHVVEAAGFELTALLDEPTAANAVLKIEDGAIVDIGGGTTGITVMEKGQVVFVADEATGGTHFSLVVAGAYDMSFDQADIYKRNPAHHQELLPVLRPVIEKVASIVTHYIKGFDVKALYLVGGTCCLTGIEAIIEKQTSIPTFKPDNPMFVTPLGIALNCTQIESINR